MESVSDCSARSAAASQCFGSAFAFAAVHGLLEGFLLIFVLGLGLAIIREVSDSVVPGFVLHATFNAIAIAGAALSAG